MINVPGSHYNKHMNPKCENCYENEAIMCVVIGRDAYDYAPFCSDCVREALRRPEDFFLYLPE